MSPTLIVLEATGGYETPLVAALAASLPVVVANPGLGVIANNLVSTATVLATRDATRPTAA